VKSLRDLPVATKLVGSTVLVFLLSFIALAILYSRGAERAVIGQAYAELEALRESRSPLIQSYFSRMERRLELAAESDWARDMLRLGPAAFRAYPREAGLGGMDAATALQRAFITNAPDSAVAARRLDSGAGTSYDRLHAQVHAVTRQMAAALGMFDILLVDLDGTVVYGAKKEPDFATNLRTGPLRESPLAVAFARAVSASATRAVQHVDYRDYAPSLGTPQAFISSPVFSSTGALLGVIVFQLPATEINAITTIHAGMGASGENYLVGPDSLMRTESRFGAGRTILRQRVETEAARRALAGESGTLIQLGYRGTGVLAAYAPLKVLGTTWANVITIDRDEVLTSVVALRNRMAGFGFVVFLISGAVLVVLLRGIVLTPLSTLMVGARRVQQGNYDAPVAVRGGDEIGQLGSAFNSMVSSVKSRVDELRDLSVMNQAILEGAPEGVLTTGEDGVISFANKKITEIFGYDASELIGKPVEVLLPERFRERHPKLRQGYVKEHVNRQMGSLNRDFLGRRKDGSEVPVDVSLSMVQAHGVPLVLAAIRDVTERKAAQEELKLINLLADTALDLTRSAYWHVDYADTGYYQASPRAQEIYGEVPRESGRYHIIDEWLSRIIAVDPKAAEIAGDRYQGTVDGKYSLYDATHPYKRPIDGRIVWLHAHGTVVRDKAGKPLIMYGVVQDITQQKLLEHDLKAEQHRLEAAAFGANLGLWDVDPVSGQIHVNEILESQVGYKRGDLRQSDEKWAALRGGLSAWPELLHPEDRPVVVQRIGDHLVGKTETYKVEHRVRGPDGSYKWILAVGRSAERDANGNSLRVNGVHIDINEMKALQEKLESQYRALEKLEELRDSLTHMIVHDLRSPLTALLGYIDMVQPDVAQPRSADSLKGAKRGATSLMQMINALLDVNKMEAGEMKLELAGADLVAVAREAIDSLGGLEGDRQVVLDQAGSVPCRCDTVLMQRVIANLLGNAFRYSPRKSTITVAVHTRGENVRVEVRDTGPGIPEEYRQRIFEKFGRVEDESGKKNSYSTGLGLAFCKMATEAHGGVIGVDSVLKQGSTFWLELPLSS
jgi:PAS domain S-box-containing protein